MPWFYQFIKGVRYREPNSDRTEFSTLTHDQAVKNGYNVCWHATAIAGAEHNTVQKKLMQAVKTHTRHSNAW